MATGLVNELEHLGLSEKEAKVYLASLELGPSPVQVIAAKASVNRPTTYVMIESLTAKGLVSSFQKGKKRFFTAETPDSLLTLVREEKKKAQDKETRIESMMGDLKALSGFSTNPPNVSFYEGFEGINALREDIVRSKVKELLEIVPIDAARKYFSAELGPDDLRSKVRKSVTTRTIFSSSDRKALSSEKGRKDLRYLDPKKNPFNCEVAMFGNKTVFLSYSGKPTGFLVDSKDVANTMRMMFEALWVVAEK